MVANCMSRAALRDTSQALAMQRRLGGCLSEGSTVMKGRGTVNRSDRRNVSFLGAGYVNL